MKRRLFTLAAALSLFMCVATVGLWVRSYWWWDAIEYRYAVFQTSGMPGGRLIGITFGSEQGCIVIERSAFAHVGAGVEVRSGRAGTRFGFLLRQGVMPWRYARPLTVGSAIIVSHWLIAALLSLPALGLAIAQTRRWRRRARTVDGRCPTCGYDLRATPQRCPECGAVPAVK